MQHYKIYLWDDYERSLNPKGKWDSLEGSWCFDTSTRKGKSWFDLEDVFLSAAKQAMSDWGWECKWDLNPPTFVALGEDGSVSKAQIDVELAWDYFCGDIEEIKHG